MASRILERPSGRGAVYHIPPDDTASAATYDLVVTQDMIPTGTGEEIPGLKGIRGHIIIEDAHIPFQLMGVKLTLQLKDRRKLDFYFEDSNGTMRGTGAFY